MSEVLINRVANSGLITIKLDDYYPVEPMVSFDLKDYLFQEFILKEKDFRAALKAYDWSSLEGKILLVYCSTDAIIPVWAYMLVAGYATPFVAQMYQGTKDDFIKFHYKTLISKMDTTEYAEKKVVVKGCSDKPVPASAYLDMMQHLQPVVQSIMYGEPCSTVPIFKRPRKL